MASCRQLGNLTVLGCEGINFQGVQRIVSFHAVFARCFVGKLPATQRQDQNFIRMRSTGRLGPSCRPHSALRCRMYCFLMRLPSICRTELDSSSPL